MKSSKLIITIIILLTLISLAVPKGSCLDVSCRAIKARESSKYSPNTAWDLGYSGKGINIVIMDCGVDDEHESLQGKFVAGVDFTEIESPLHPRDGSDNPDGKYFHGTVCASIAMGTGGSEGKYMGVAPDARLIDIKVEAEHEVGTNWEIYQRIIDALEWCIAHKDDDWNHNGLDEYDGIDIISLSEGVGLVDSNGTDELAVAVNKAVDAGIIVVASMGNEGPDNKGVLSIAAADKAITVGAIDDRNTTDRSDDEIADFSSRGQRRSDDDDDPYDELKPDIVAPGCNITAANYAYVGSAKGYSDQGSGTSWSTPHVSGVVALMLEANPYLTPEEVKMILLETAEQRGTPEYPDYPFPYNKWNRAYGCGIVDAYAAVKRALELKPPEPNKIPTITIDSPKNNAKVSNTITISGTALDTDGNVSNVELKIDNNDWFNVSIISANSLEWNYTWDTKNVENGMHTLSARAFDGENYSLIASVDVNVYNKVSAGAEEKIKINPVYLISAAGIISVVVVIVVCVLLFRRKKPSMKPSFPVDTGIPPPPVTGVPSVSAQCPNCGNIIEITSAERPLTVQCLKCGAKGLLR